MKKFWVLGVLVVTLIIITITYIRLVLTMSDSRSAYDAIPASTAIIFDFVDVINALDKLNEGDFADHLSKAGFIKKIKGQTSAINTLMLAGDTSKEVQSPDRFLAGMSLIEQRKIDFLYVLTDNRYKESEFNKLIQWANTQGSVRKRIFRDEGIHEISLPETGLLTCAFVNGIFMGSFSSFLVEEAIVQLKDKTSILKDKSFKEINELAGKDADVVMLLNFKKLGLLESLLISREEPELFQGIQQFGDWMELDIKIKDQGLMINGYTNFMDVEHSFLSRLKGKATNSIGAAHIMPDITSMFFYHSLSDFRDYNDALKTANSGEIKINNLINWVGDEWCFGVLEPFDKDFEEEAFVVIKATDVEVAKESLRELGTITTGDSTVEGFKDHMLGRLKLEDEMNEALGFNFLPLRNPYYTFIDNYVILANNTAAIKTFVSNFREGQTLARDPDYLTFEKKLTTSSNFYFYMNTSRSAEILGRILGDVLSAAIYKGQKGFIKFSPVAFQFNHYDDIFFTNGYIRFSSSLEESTNQMWVAKLDAPIRGNPVFVTNHYTDDTEILVQDRSNNLYLFTKSGKLLWKREIDGPIKGEVYEIDFYENTKLQYLFNTPSKIYLIDRTGSDVANFPIKLPAKASNGMLLVDYDNKKNYRYFVACENKKIYGYYRSGKPLPGWSPKSKVGLIEYPMKHVLLDGKDYLIAINNKGIINYFNRRGEKRAKSMNLKTKFNSDFDLRITDKSFQLYNADNEGYIYKVYHGGTYSSQKQNIPTAFFDFHYEDLNADGKYECIFVDSSLIRVFDETYNEITASSYIKQIDQPAYTLTYNGRKQGIGFTSTKDGQVYFVDVNYEFHESFPLSSCGGFAVGDIFDTGRRVVVTGDCEGNLSAFQIK